MLNSLIFDVDGTLAETEEIHRRAFNDTFAEWGLDWHWDQTLYQELLATTGGKERIAAYIEKYRPPGHSIALALIAKLHVFKTARYTELLRQDALELRPGVARLICEARERGLLAAIATTTSLANVKALVETSFKDRGRGLFDVIVAGDEVEQKKPAPDVYRLALKKLKSRPENCIAIEDSRNGLLSASAAGIAAVITPSFYFKDDDFREAVAVMSDLGSPEEPYLWIRGEGRDGNHVTMSMLQDFLMARPCP